MLVAGVQRCVQAKVYPHAASHDLLAVHLLTYCDCGVDIEEGNDDTLERFERRPSVYRRVSVYGFPYLDKV
jgi:hypothetical protein